MLPIMYKTLDIFHYSTKMERDGANFIFVPDGTFIKDNFLVFILGSLMLFCNVFLKKEILL